MTPINLGQVQAIHVHATNPPPKNNMLWSQEQADGSFSFLFYNGTAWERFDATFLTFSVEEVTSLSATVTINHNLGRRMRVQIYDSSGNMVIAPVNSGLNTITVTFSPDFTGEVHYF